MNLANDIIELANQHQVNIESKTIHSLNKFINDLGTEPAKAHDFETMVKKIQKSYREKSYKSEKFFIENIAHTFNTNSNEYLFDFKSLDLSENFHSRISEQSLHHYKNITQDSSTTENEIVNAVNNLIQYSHKQNTQFIEHLDAKYSFKKLAKVKYIDYKNKDKTPVMLTFTLDKEFRKYIKKSDVKLGEFEGLEEINKEANLELLIEKSYKRLNAVYKKFYYYFKTLNKRSGNKDKLDFIMIFEPHKSLTLHLHILYYCNEIQLANLKRAWKNYLKDLTTEQQKGQDFKIIDTSIANASTYLSKYLIKEYNTETDEASFFNQFKRYFSKLKLFRTSNFYFTTQAKIDKMYSYLTANYPDILEQIKLSDTPIYEVLEQFEIQGLFRFEKEKVDSLSFDRKKIKKFYKAYASTHNGDEIKKKIKNNIGSFTKFNSTSRISEAIFTLDYKKLSDIFQIYNIDMNNISSEKQESDKFYSSKMYELYEVDINQSLSIANNKYFEALLTA